jgi:pyruvate dehydrogenase E2 component (dihydrolipoamide acetyltransferase)
VEDDVRASAEGQTAAAEPAVPPGLPEPSKIVPLEGIRKGIADHMRRSVAGTAQLSFFLELDVTEVQRLRRDASGRGSGTIAMADVLIKACAETLTRHPEHNTVLSDGRVLYFDEVNIGLAVALSEGLIVPVVKGADKKGVFEISKETSDLADRARDGKLLPDEVSSGTFTISVLGSVDGFTPILNAGQSAILGVGRSVEKPVVKGGEVVVREMMTVSLTVDHQVIDGALAAGFLRRLQQIVGRPAALFK